MKPSNQTPLDVNPSIGLSLSVFVHPAIDLGFGVQSPKTQNSIFSTVMSHAPKCTKCTKTHQGLCLACKNSVTSVTVLNVTGVPNVTSTPTVQKMIKNHCSVALFRVLPLPVSADIRFITSLLEADVVIKMLFEQCRFLLPVWSYGGLKFWEGR